MTIHRFVLLAEGAAFVALFLAILKPLWLP
jgi:hypothetical protein